VPDSTAHDHFPAFLDPHWDPTGKLDIILAGILIFRKAWVGLRKRPFSGHTALRRYREGRRASAYPGRPQGPRAHSQLQEISRLSLSQIRNLGALGVCCLSRNGSRQRRCPSSCPKGYNGGNEGSYFLEFHLPPLHPEENFVSCFMHVRILTWFPFWVICVLRRRRIGRKRCGRWCCHLRCGEA